MSQASRYKALAPVREREQVARELAQFISGAAPITDTAAFSMVATRAESIASGATFNVHAAREHATRLTLYGRHYALKPGPVGDFAMERPGSPWVGLDGHDLAYQRLGLRILAALEGQPSECDRCGGTGIRRLRTRWRKRLPDKPCPDCHGTGHNLRGELPPVKPTPQMLRRLTEAEGGFYDDTQAEWLNRLARIIDPDGAVSALELVGPHGVDHRTRTVPRGTHRRVVAAARASLDARLTARGLRREQMSDRLAPRWRRGELRHAEQRREREQAGELVAMSVGYVDG